MDVESLLTLHYSKVLEELLREVGGQEENKPITIILAENYLEDDSIQKIISFVLSKTYIRDNLVEFDVSNNRFKRPDLSALKSLVELCPRLARLNIAINYISSSEFKENLVTDSILMKLHYLPIVNLGCFLSSSTRQAL